MAVLHRPRLARRSASRGPATGFSLRRYHGWQIEQGYQQLKEELGLDHFEGRSWRGFHHHACLVMLAYSFFQLTADCAALSLGR